MANEKNQQPNFFENNGEDPAAKEKEDKREKREKKSHRLLEGIKEALTSAKSTRSPKAKAERRLQDAKEKKNAGIIKRSSVRSAKFGESLLDQTVGSKGIIAESIKGFVSQMNPLAMARDAISAIPGTGMIGKAFSAAKDVEFDDPNKEEKEKKEDREEKLDDKREDGLLDSGEQTEFYLADISDDISHGFLEVGDLLEIISETLTSMRDSDLKSKLVEKEERNERKRASRRINAGAGAGAGAGDDDDDGGIIGNILGGGAAGIGAVITPWLTKHIWSRIPGTKANKARIAAKATKAAEASKLARAKRIANIRRARNIGGAAGRGVRGLGRFARFAGPAAMVGSLLWDVGKSIERHYQEKTMRLEGVIGKEGFEKRGNKLYDPETGQMFIDPESNKRDPDTGAPPKSEEKARENSRINTRRNLRKINETKIHTRLTDAFNLLKGGKDAEAQGKLWGAKGLLDDRIKIAGSLAPKTEGEAKKLMSFDDTEGIKQKIFELRDSFGGRGGKSLDEVENSFNAIEGIRKQGRRTSGTIVPGDIGQLSLKHTKRLVESILPGGELHGKVESITPLEGQQTEGVSQPTPTQIQPPPPGQTIAGQTIDADRARIDQDAQQQSANTVAINNQPTTTIDNSVTTSGGGGGGDSQMNEPAFNYSREERKRGEIL